MLETFNLDDAPLPERSGVFQREMARRFSIGLALEASSGEPLRSTITAYSGRRLQFAALQFSPHRTVRAGLRSHDAAPRLLVSLQQTGSVVVQQGGRTAEVRPGEMFVIDLQQPFEIETTRMGTRSVYLNGASLRAAVPQLDALTARAIECRTGAGALFARFVDEMFRLAPTLSERTADAVADALPHVFTTALSGLSTSFAPSPSRVRAAQRQAIRRHVAEHLRDPALDVAAIAAGVGLSPRRVYEALEGEPQPLMRQVWAQRLDQCAKELATPALTARSVGEIAYGWGFTDLAHFSRAFRRRFGEPPSVWRRSQLRLAADKGDAGRIDDASAAREQN